MTLSIEHASPWGEPQGDPDWRANPGLPAAEAGGVELGDAISPTIPRADPRRGQEANWQALHRPGPLGTGLAGPAPTGPPLQATQPAGDL